MKLSYVDTNYFIRLLVADEPGQYKTATLLFKRAEEGIFHLFASTVVFFEVYWVLKTRYSLNKEECHQKLLLLLQLKSIQFEDWDILDQALEIWSSINIDLEDCYHLAKAQNLKCKELFTFDQKLKRHSSLFLKEVVN